MHKLIIQFLKPERQDVPDFEARWSEEFVPRAESMPGIRKVSVSRIYASVTGQPDLHLVHEFFFDDAEAVQRAMASPDGQQAGKALIDIAGDRVRLFFAEHLEEERPAAPRS